MDGIDEPSTEQLRAWDCQRAEDPGSVPWPDYIGCPWLPWGRDRQWFIFEEPATAPGRAKRRVYLSAAQIREGAIEALQIRDDLLIAWFPSRYPDDGRWSREAVATWLFRHIAIADQTRIDRQRRMVARWDQQHAVTPRPPEPVTLTWSGDKRVSHVRSLHVAPHGPDGVALAITVAIPGQDAAGFKATLTAEQVRQLRTALPVTQP